MNASLIVNPHRQELCLILHTIYYSVLTNDWETEISVCGHGAMMSGCGKGLWELNLNRGAKDQLNLLPTLSTMCTLFLFFWTEWENKAFKNCIFLKIFIGS